MKKNLLALSAASLALVANTTLFAYPYSNQSTHPSYNQTPSTYYDNLDNGQSQNQYYQNQGTSPYNRNPYNSSDNMQTPRNNSYYYNQGQEQDSSYSRNPYMQTQQNPSYYYNQGQEENPSSYYNQNQNGYQNNSTNNSRYNASPNSSSYMNRSSYHHQISYDEASNRYSDDKYPQDSAASEADRQLNEKIRSKISGWFTDSYKNISLKTVNGVVNISGTVKTSDDTKKLLDEISKIEGVRSVNANVSSEEYGNNKSSNSSNKYPQDRATSEADRQLNTKIRDKIAGWFTDSYKNVALNTSNGNVNITGLVKNNEDLTKLVQELRKVDGVRNVSANVQFTEESDQRSNSNSKYSQDRATSEADRQLNAKIRDKISGWFTDSYKNIALNTSNGNVNITGLVKNNDDLTKLVQELRKIDGVRNVSANVQFTEENRESAANFDDPKYAQAQDNSIYAQNNNSNNSKYPQDRAASEADRQLNEKIRSKISGWFVDNYKNVILNTSNGDVSLSGMVNNNEDLTNLLNDVRKVDGVRNVNNNVQVKELK